MLKLFSINNILQYLPVHCVDSARLSYSCKAAGAIFSRVLFLCIAYSRRKVSSAPICKSALPLPILAHVPLYRFARDQPIDRQLPDDPQSEYHESRPKVSFHPHHHFGSLDPSWNLRAVCHHEHPSNFCNSGYTEWDWSMVLWNLRSNQWISSRLSLFSPFTS